MIRAIAPNTYAVACDRCGGAGVGAEDEPANARRLAALMRWKQAGDTDLCPKCTSTEPPPSRFPLGQVCATPEIIRRLTFAQIVSILERHRLGDWGDVAREDARANEDALSGGARILSAYQVVLVGDNAAEATRVWIITEADRSATTIHFPGEY